MSSWAGKSELCGLKFEGGQVVARLDWGALSQVTDQVYAEAVNDRVHGIFLTEVVALFPLEAHYETREPSRSDLDTSL